MTEHNHDDLAHSLAQHLQQEARMVWENIPAGCAGNVRPDVYTLQKSFSSPNPITYEVKVSLSDFRSDVTTAKWKTYLRFSYGVVFAVPKGLIEKKDLPTGCGLITYNGAGIWRMVKKPTLHPCQIDSDVLLKLLMGGAKRMTQPKYIQPREFDNWKHWDTLRDKWGKDIAEKISLIKEYPQMKKELKALKSELAEMLDLDIDGWNFIDSAQHRIKKIRIMANETDRKKAIAQELEKLKTVLGADIDRLVHEYAPTEEDSR